VVADYQSAPHWDILADKFYPEQEAGMTAQQEVAHIGNVSLEIEVQLDNRWMKLSEILALEEGSIIEMSRSAGENIDIFIGKKLAAFGEIVIIESTMGVRITDFNIER
jgi:flagellar motor switch protein FliN